MKHFYSTLIKKMEDAVHRLAAKVVPPRKVPFKDSFIYRYSECSAEQAIVQKLARVVTTLHSAYILLEHGFLQEQAALHRILGELHEDVSFLAFAVIVDDITPLHQSFLDAFYAEELDPNGALEVPQKRQMIPRPKVQAYITNFAQERGFHNDPCQALRSMKAVTKVYSGFVHAASPQIMEMYGGNPSHFQVDGMKGTNFYADHMDEIWNYFYRSLTAFWFAAKALDDRKLFTELEELITKLLEKRKNVSQGC